MTARVVHGGLTAAEREELAGAGVDVVDLSANVNPYGPLPRVLRAARQTRLDRYPDVDAATLRAAYANAHGLDPAQVLAGHGSSELIYLAARAFVSAGGAGLVAGPTFGEYAAAIGAAGGRVIELRAEARDGFRLDSGQLVEVIRKERPGVVFLCNPNNPTGSLTAGDAIEAITDAARGCSAIVVIDEAYMEFAATRAAPSSPAPGRLILRSLTKLHSIPGLRLGLMAGNVCDIDRVRMLQPPWAVSAPAAAAALQSLGEGEFERRSVARLTATREMLTRDLADRGWDVTPSEANFVLVQVGDGSGFRSRLLLRGFAVRDCASFGLPEYVRIAVPHHTHLDRLAVAMEDARG